jgi:hypothetical protein
LGEIPGLHGNSSQKYILYSLVLGSGGGVIITAVLTSGLIPTEPLISRILRPVSVWYAGISVLQFVYAFSLTSANFASASKSSMKLKRFTEDLFMGLKPFGTAAVHLAGTASLLFSTLLLVFIPSLVLALGSPPASFLLTQVVILSIILSSTALIVAEYLRPYHRIMQQEKSRTILWVNSLYSELVRNIESSDSSRFDRLSNIAGIGRLQDDVQKIKEWPIDMHILARILATIGLASTFLTLATNVKLFLP